MWLFKRNNYLYSSRKISQYLHSVAWRRNWKVNAYVCNCQSFLWFKIKNSCSKDYVKAYFEINSKSIILKESKV